MKQLCVICLCLAATLPMASAQGAPAAKMRDAATHDELVPAYQKGERESPMRKMKPSKGADPSVINQPKSLLSRSDIICFGGYATLVPKGAVLNLPKNMADRLKFVPGSQIQGWSEFYAQNRGWITTVEVSRTQAEGSSAIATEISERTRKSTNLVVAVFKGGPISVMPPKPPPSNKNEAAVPGNAAVPPVGAPTAKNPAKAPAKPVDNASETEAPAPETEVPSPEEGAPPTENTP